MTSTLNGFLTQYPPAQAPKGQTPKAQARAQSTELSSLGLFLAQNAAPQIPKAQARVPRQDALNSDRLVILRMGLGRDSVAMMILLSEGALVVDGRTIGPDEVDAIVFTDPGYEWPATYAVKERVDAFAKAMGIPFLAQEKPPAEGPTGWISWLQERTHRKAALQAELGKKVTLEYEERPWQASAPPLPVRNPADYGKLLTAREIKVLRARADSGYYHLWPPILETYQSRNMVIKMNDAGCTLNHKINPNRMLLNDMAAIRFGVESNTLWSSAVVRGKRPAHLVLLGIAADEVGRLKKLDSEKAPKYEINAYPLIEMGIGRKDETPILKRHGFEDVQKSGCMMCKFQGADWYWALSVLSPEIYETVTEYEENAIRAAMAEKRPLSNALLLGVGPKYKRASLPTGRLQEHVDLWRQEHPEATVASVLANEYKSCSSRYSEKGSASRLPAPARCRMCGEAG